MNGPRRLARWLQAIAVCGLAVALVASVAPSAGAAQRKHEHHHKHHHRHHHKTGKVKAARQTRAQLP